MPCEINCKRTFEFDEAPKVEANGDISGIGVIIGFLAPAYLCVVITSIYYIFEHNPRLDPYRTIKSPEQVVNRPNPIDYLLYRWFRGQKTAPVTSNCPPSPAESDSSKALCKLMGQCVLSLADIQIIAGLAILISGYIALPQCLQLYHWQMVVLLAWFSTITHLCTLTFLRNHFYTHPRQRVVRLFLMVIIMVLLIVALVPLSDSESTPGIYFETQAGSAMSGAYDGEHAICYLSYGLNGWRMFDGFVTHLFLLVYGSFSRALKLFPTRVWGNKVRVRLAYVLQKLTCMARNRASIDRAGAVPFVHAPLLAAYVATRFYVHYFISVAAEIHYLWFVIAWGSNRVVSLRTERGPEDENSWSFGQVIPVILLLGPIFALWDTIGLPSSFRNTFRGATRGRQSDFQNKGNSSPVWERLEGAWCELKERASDFPLWSQELRESRLLRKAETTVERTKRITVFMDSQRSHDAVPLWHGYLFVHILLHWLSAVFVIIQDGLNPVNRRSSGAPPVSQSTLPNGPVPYTQLFSTPPAMVFVFLWISYLAELYAWGAATVMMAFLGTAAVVVTAYPWWDGQLVRNEWSYLWPNYMIGLFVLGYLIIGLPLWYGISLSLDLLRHRTAKTRDERGSQANLGSAMELAENGQTAVATHLLPGSSQTLTAGRPSTSDLELGDLGARRGGQPGD